MIAHVKASLAQLTQLSGPYTNVLRIAEVNADYKPAASGDSEMKKQKMSPEMTKNVSDRTDARGVTSADETLE